MRILVFTHYWLPHRGGVETVAREQCTRLAARGHSVTVVTSRLKGDPEEQEEQGVRVVRVRCANVLERRGIPYPVMSPTLLARALQLARESDVVMAHSHLFQTSVAGLTAAKLLRKPSLILQHNSRVTYPEPWQFIEDLADQTLGAYALNAASRRLAVSEVAAGYARSICHQEVGVLHNGVDTQRFRVASTAERAAARKQWDVPADAKVALTVRRLTFKNGLDTLLDALERIPPERRPLLLVAGGGPDKAAIQRYVDEHGLARQVRLLGFVSDDALPSAYQAADCFVLPSRSGEGFPMVILEAMASGLPCLATRTGGQTEVVKEGETGWLIPPEAPAVMAEALERAFAPETPLAALRKNARARSESLDWDVQVGKLEAHLVALS